MVSKIKKLCDKKGISIYELEKKCGIGNGTIGRWDTSSPSLRNIKKVADYFKVSINTLLKED